MNVYLLYKFKPSVAPIHFMHGVYSTYEKARDDGIAIVKHDSGTQCWVEEHEVDEPGGFTLLTLEGDDNDRPNP